MAIQTFKQNTSRNKAASLGRHILTQTEFELLLTLRRGENILVTLIGLVLGTVTFAAIGLAMAGALRAELTLAGANALFLIFILLGGGILPLSHLPAPLAAVAQWLPAAALTQALQASMSNDAAFPGFPLLVLSIWAVVILTVAIRTFQWE